MSIIYKCKICGGDLILDGTSNIATCDYCGTQQTVPSADNEKKLAQFERADRLRRNGDFDKAAGLYEAIVTEFREDAEAYWGLVLCKYGVEYVDDPISGKKIPTCHRSSFESIMEDEDFDQALENADPMSRRLYRDEAKQLEEIRKGIIEISQKEAPYDIFICYKETDFSGNRTLDSVLAQDIYDALTTKGYRVFFARITLEDHLGEAYEPYIFAALHSAKVMLAVGTDYEHYNAVWVKNEWSRFLKLMATDKTKHLIPCYKGIDAYDMPKEFAKLQAQDLGKVGAMQDLLRGVEKLVSDATQGNASVVVQSGVSANVASLLKLGFIALEDLDWGKAQTLFEDALKINADCGSAFLGLSLCTHHVSSKEEFLKVYVSSHALEDDKNIQRARKYADKDLSEWFAYVDQEKANEERARLAKIPLLEEKRKQAEEIAKMIAVPDNGVHLLCRNINGDVILANKHPTPSINPASYQWKKITSVITGYRFAMGIKGNGEVVAEGEINVDHWHKIVEATSGHRYAIGLKRDGSVTSTGQIPQKEIQAWTSICAICADQHRAWGLKKDGTVVTAGNVDSLDKYSGFERWKNIIAISASDEHIVGLKSDGTVVATGYDRYGQCKVEGWKDVVSISTAGSFTVGLKKDGTVVAAGGYDINAQQDVQNWQDIISIATGGSKIVGLKYDGTVVVSDLSSEYPNKNLRDVSTWTDIVAIKTDGARVYGINNKGWILIAGYETSYLSSAKSFRLFNSLEVFQTPNEVSALDSIDKEEDQEKNDENIVDKAELLRIAEAQKAEAVKKAEMARLARIAAAQKAEQERLARKAEADRLAAIAAERKKEQERIIAAKKAEMARIEAEKKARQERIDQVKAQCDELEKEIAQLKGLFSGKRRKDLTAQLEQLKEKISKM